MTDGPQQLYLSKTRTPTVPTSSQGSDNNNNNNINNNTKTRKSRRSSKFNRGSETSPDRSSRKSSSSRRSSSSSKRSSTTHPSSDKPSRDRRSSRPSSSSSRSPATRERRSKTSRSTSHDTSSDSSISREDQPGAFAINSLNPPTAGSSTANTITSRETMEMMVAAEVSPDREMEVRQAYEQGAQDMRNNAMSENDQLRLRVRALEEQQNNGYGNVVVAIAREDEDDEEKSRFSKGTIICCFLFCVLALAGAIVGGIFGIRQGQPNTTNIVVVLPPTFDECESVSNGTGIVDQEFVESTSLYLDLAVIKESAGGGMTPFELQNLKQRILLYILTVLLGCTEEDIRILEERILGIENPSNNRWLLQENGVNSTAIFQNYVVGSTLISDISVWDSNEACLEYPDLPCTHVRLVLKVYLQVEVAEEELLTAVITEFKRQPLVPRLKLVPNQPYELIEVVTIAVLPEDYTFAPTVPTLEPTSPALFAYASSSPSWNPSFSPSFGQGNGGNPAATPTTPMPVTPEPTTSSPTKAPVIGPSPDPTPSPTKEPTDEPSLTPSMAPSPPPTVRPTKAPTQTPTRRPTPFPSGNPTPNPTPGPTRNPTPRPTPNPTTPNPTRAPTRSPSQVPSRHPSPVPSMLPSISPSSSPTGCPTPSCSGPNTCVGWTADITVHPCGSCSVDQDCSYSGSMSIGQGSCNGKEECNGGYGMIIGDFSCNGGASNWDGSSSTHSCAALHSVQIGSNSCNCAECCACFDYGVVIGDNECNTPGDCCTTFGGTHSVGAGSCNDSSASRTYACLGSKGTIGTNSCNGLVACKRQRNEIGDESCNGVYACPFRSGNVGSASCVGYKACYGGYDATIGNGSCNGSDACKQRNEVQIGDGSCNCQECCSCLPQGSIVPSGSCNSRAASPSDIDFVSGVGGTRCCYYASLPP